MTWENKQYTYTVSSCFIQWKSCRMKISSWGKRQKSNRRQDDFYTLKAQKEGYVARSAYKLEEIDKKFKLFHPMTRFVLDIGCSPWSRLQYVSKQLPTRQPKSAEWLYQEHIIWLDLKPAKVELPGVATYVQDATDLPAVRTILTNHAIPYFDVMLSDMAPDTTSCSDLDALRSIAAIEQILPLVESYLAPDGIFVCKVFMGPWFDQLLQKLKSYRWASHIRTFKPQSCRKASKETFIIKS